MPSYYVVVQYVPDPIANERINIGFIAFGQDRILSRFLKNWRRVERFGGRDIASLRQFAREFPVATAERQLPLPNLPGTWSVNEAELRGMVAQWVNSIQFTAPRASLLEPEDVIASISPKFLQEPVKQQKKYRDRRSVASLAAKHILESLGAEGRGLLKRNYSVPGTRDEHQFDLAVANGHLLCVLHSLSFEVEDTHELRKDVDSTAWAIHDVRDAAPDLPIAIATLPPRGQSKAYTKARKVFESLGAPMLPEDAVGGWAEEVVEKAGVFSETLYELEDEAISQ